MATEAETGEERAGLVEQHAHLPAIRNEVKRRVQAPLARAVGLDHDQDLPDPMGEDGRLARRQ